MELADSCIAECVSELPGVLSGPPGADVRPGLAAKAVAGRVNGADIRGRESFAYEPERTRALGVGLLIVVLTLSSRNAADQQDLVERAIAQTLCFDTLERFAHHELARPLPGDAPRPPAYPVSGPRADLFGPLELDLKRTTLFDHALLRQFTNLEMKVTPKIERQPDPKVPGLFLLTVRIGCTDRTGRRREVHQSRYCFAP